MVNIFYIKHTLIIDLFLDSPSECFAKMELGGVDESGKWKKRSELLRVPWGNFYPNFISFLTYT